MFNVSRVYLVHTIYHVVFKMLVSIDPNGNRMMLRIDNSTLERHP
jgi:hypothetical protein